MEQASDKDRRYFERISRANKELEDGGVPESLAEMFDRLEGRVAVAFPKTARSHPTTRAISKLT